MDYGIRWITKYESPTNIQNYENMTRGSQQAHIQRKDLIHPELSYRVVGALYDVFNDLGFGHLERVYQRAIAKRLQELRISYREQVLTSVPFHSTSIGKHYLDFLVEDKLVLELKQRQRLSRAGIDQILGYLHATHLQLGILATFTPGGVTYLRIVNTPGHIS